MKTIQNLAIIVLILGLLLGCSGNLKVNEDYSSSSMDAVENESKKLSILYTELVYSKNSSHLNWESGNSDDVQPAIMDKYKDKARIAPGGYIIEETSTEYFICVSIYGVESVTEGFEITSITIPNAELDTDPLLVISAKRVNNDISGASDTDETVYVTSLISILKEDLPDSISLGSISLLLDEIL